jgi:amino acid permease
MNEFETFIAIIKGYCGAVILFCPKAFGNGGFLYSVICLVASGIFTSICAIKLIKCG